MQKTEYAPPGPHPAVGVDPATTSPWYLVSIPVPTPPDLPEHRFDGTEPMPAKTSPGAEGCVQTYIEEVVTLDSDWGDVGISRRRHTRGYDSSSVHYTCHEEANDKTTQNESKDREAYAPCSSQRSLYEVSIQIPLNGIDGQEKADAG